ncbi:MAG: type IV secretory system conjugative DNA transfer family protein [Patescibacteria group bacterium]
MYNPEKITYFAETDSRNKRVNFGIKAKDRLKHVYVIGKTGMGKSTLLENMAVQDIKGNEGMAFLDPHGKSAELLLEYVPPERVKDVIYFAPFDTEHPISFNVMEDVGVDKRHLVANGLMSAFKKIWVDAWSARMEYILNNILLALLEYPGSTLVGVNRMLADKPYRLKVVENIKDPSVKSFWVDEFEKYGEKYMQEAGAAIQNKIGQFISNPLVRNIIGQEKSSFDLRKLMDEGKIIIINLSKGRVGEANANLIGSMLITKIYLAAMSRADKSDTELQKLPNFYLYVDEFQSFANESFADILSEARKYKLNLTIAHQYIEQMAEEVRAAVFGNVGTMITFRVGAYDAEVLEKEFAPTFTAEDLVNLGSYQIYLKLMIDGIGSQPFSAMTMAPIEKPATSSAEEIIRNSRRIYATPKLEVEKKIQAWHEEGRVVKPEKRADKKYEPRKYEPRVEPRPAFVPKPAPPPAPFPVQPEDDFKPLKGISLDMIKQTSNNQRPVSQKNMSELRNALSSIVKTQSTVHKPEPVTPPKPPQVEPKKPKEIPEAELKALLDVE